MKTKQTAVDWLINELANTGLLVTKDVENLVAYNKAKQMEKEQIKDAYDNGGEHYTEYGKAILGEDYYNENYGK